MCVPQLGGVQLIPVNVVHPCLPLCRLMQSMGFSYSASGASNTVVVGEKDKRQYTMTPVLSYTGVFAGVQVGVTCLAVAWCFFWH